MENTKQKDGGEVRQGAGGANSKGILLFMMLLLIGLIAVMVYVFRQYNKTANQINAKLSATELYLNEPLVYADNTAGAQSWLWEFGNGDQSTTQEGSYSFLKSGTYVLRLTVDANLREQFIVTVKDTIPTMVMDSVVRISGATTGIVFEEIRLEAEGPGSIYEWWFGETGQVDAIGKSALYTYAKPGKYTITLRSDRSAEMATHEILIIDPNEELFSDLEKPGEGERKALDDLRQQIQAIANGADFNSKYHYILDTYLCRNEKVKVNVVMGEEKKQMDIYAYLMGLTFSSGLVIDEVKVSLVPNSDCVNTINVKQQY